jgi:hypothetical protein
MVCFHVAQAYRGGKSVSHLLASIVLGFLMLLCRGRDPAKPPTPAGQVRSEELEKVPPPPGEHYYILMFGSEGSIKVPRRTHTWAAAVKASLPPGGPPTILQTDAISWMPAIMRIRPWRFRVEEGTNLELHETIQYALDKRERVSMWGPYELRPGLYRKFLMQKAFMESGQVGYQAVDTCGEAGRLGNGSDCIHAITDADPIEDRSAYPLRRFGDTATEFIVKQLFERELLIDPYHTEDWLIAPLGLECYPIIRQTYCGPAVPAYTTH